MLNLPPPSAGWRRVLLVRHGETEANEKGIVQGSRLNAPLNAKGHEQAKDLGRFLSKFNIKLVCTSALERAKQTAAHIVGKSGSTLGRMELRELNEMDYGEKWDGVDIRKVLTELRTLAMRWANGDTEARCPDGGESPKDVLDRVSTALHSVVQAMETEPNDAMAVIIAHNFVNKILLSHSEMGSVQYMHKFEQQHTCVNVLDVDFATGRVHVKHINFHEHVSRL